MAKIQGFKLTSRHIIGKGEIREDTHTLEFGFKRLGPQAVPPTIRSIRDVLIEMLEGGFMEEENAVIEFRVETIFEKEKVN